MKPLTYTLNTLAAGAALLALWSAPAYAGESRFTVGLWGDMPYAKAKDEAAMPALLADMNGSDIAFSIYDGDIKDGSSECKDDVYAATMDMFNTLAKPVIYVPGDNEWTDCHRTNNGGFDNLERLAHIRKTMFSSVESFGRTHLVLEHQGKPGETFSENTRYVKHGVMFVMLNVPGSNNNKVNGEEICKAKSARTPAQCEADNAEWAERNAANIQWLDQSFAKAKAGGLKGIMIVLQADMGFDVPESEKDDESRLPDRDGYASFLDAVTAATKAFAGQVLLVHGDTHFFKLDKPLANATHMLPNFTRLETFGSPNAHWVKVTVDATTRNVFRVEPMIVPGNALKSLNAE